MSGNAPKILVVVLVVVAVLFFAGIAIGSNNGVGGLSLDGAISSFSGLLPSPALSITEIDSSPSGCLDPNLQRIVVPGGGSCDFQIAASSAAVRSLKLQIAAGQGVHLGLSVTVQNKPMTIKTDLPKDGNNQVTLSIFTSGGKLTIDQCTAAVGSACIIDLIH